MTVVRKSLLAAALLLAILFAGIFWLITTDSGTRWLLGRATTYLPEELQLGDARGSLLRGVSIESLEWHGEPTKVLARSLYVNIRLVPLLGKRLVIDELDVDGIDLRITDGGEPADETDGLPTIDLPVDISIVSSSVRQIEITSSDFNRTVDEIALVANLCGSDLLLTHLHLRSTWLDLDVNGRMKLADLYPGSIEADWQWKESEFGPLSGQLRITGDTREYALNHSLQTPLLIASSGVVSYESGTVNADLLHEWQSLEWLLEDRTLYSSQGELRVTGNIEAYSVELAATARIDDQPDTRIELTGDADQEAIRVSNFEAENPLGQVRAKGDVRWLPERVFDLEFSITDLDPSFVIDSVLGTVGLQGSVTGVVRNDVPDIDLRIEGIDGEINGNPVRGKGIIGVSGADISLSDTLLQVGSNSIRAAGKIGKSLSLGADIDASNIAEVFPDAAGSIRGRISLRGPREHPDVQLDLTGAAFAWREYSLDSLSANANLSAIEQGTAELQLVRFAIGDVELDEAQLSVSGQLAAHNLRASLHGMDSGLVIEATGGYDQQTWSGQLTSLAIDNDVFDHWSTHQASKVIASAEHVSLSEICLFGHEDARKVCLSGVFLADGPLSFNASASRVPLSAIPSSLPEGVTLHGYLNAELSGEWEDDRLTAKSDIEMRDAAIDAFYDEEHVSLAVAKAAGNLTVTDNRVESLVHVQLADEAADGTIQFTVQDFTDSLSAISGRADVSISDAVFFAVVIPGIMNPQGRIDGNLTVAGSMNSPQLLGEISLVDGSFGVRQAGIEVSDFDFRLAQLAPGQLRLLGSARSGDGEISIDGRTQFGAGTGLRSEIRLSGENFELARLPDWQIAASPSITVVFDDRAASITGELAIPTANIKVREIPETAVSPSPDVVVHRQESTPPSPRRRIDINVKTVLGDGVQFAGFGLTTGMEGAIQLRGGSHAVYTGQGRLNLREGRYKAYGQELEIERGELIFNGPLDNPRLNVRAVRRIDAVVAGIELSGTPAQLQSNVFSEPAMSDAEVLSYLLTGRPLTSAMSSGEGDTMSNAAFALGLSGAGAITSQVRSQLGLDTLAIEGGVDDSRLIAGKRFGDRLIVEYGYGLIDKLGTLLLRYQLTDRIVLESRTGTVSNLDVVYSVKKM